MEIGIVGLGKMGLLHASILNFFPEVHISVICEYNTKVVGFAKNMFRETTFVDDINKLGNSKLDVVYITTPIPSHYQIIQQVYSGKIADNIFTEKTLALSYEEASQLSRMAENSKGINMVGYMNRFAMTFLKGKELLERNIIGKQVSFKAHALSSDFISAKKGSTRRGSALLDLGSHAIDLALWYFPGLKIDSVTENNADTTNFTVIENNGIKGAIDVSWCKEGYRNPEVQITITGSNGSIIADNSSVRLQINNEKPTEWLRQNLDDNVPFLLGAPEYYREDEHFIKAVLSGQTAEPSFQTAAEVDRLISDILGRTK